eukprot:3939434-Rhodomonas_salina.1
MLVLPEGRQRSESQGAGSVPYRATRSLSHHQYSHRVGYSLSHTLLMLTSRMLAMRLAARSAMSSTGMAYAAIRRL